MMDFPWLCHFTSPSDPLVRELDLDPGEELLRRGVHLREGWCRSVDSIEPQPKSAATSQPLSKKRRIPSGSGELIVFGG